MKRALGLVGIGVVVVLVVALVTLRFTGLDPDERRPGLWLRGERVSAPVSDWAFTDRYPTIYLESQSRYLLPTRSRSRAWPTTASST